MQTRTKAAPKFLNLLQIRFPIGAIASIGHRVSGVLLLIALPLLTDLLDRSLRSEADFVSLRAVFASPWVVLVLSLGAWAITHHILAGIRHLLMDVGIGSRLQQARLSARVVIMLSLAMGLYVLIRGLI